MPVIPSLVRVTEARVLDFLGRGVTTVGVEAVEQRNPVGRHTHVAPHAAGLGRRLRGGGKPKGEVAGRDRTRVGPVGGRGIGGLDRERPRRLADWEIVAAQDSGAALHFVLERRRGP